ncbi:MAG: hypothetical protein PHU14_14255 [Methylovulum sp.]|nr:hypothetical protein [Methylovulum sp.]
MAARQTASNWLWQWETGGGLAWKRVRKSLRQKRGSKLSAQARQRLAGGTGKTAGDRPVLF